MVTLKRIGLVGKVDRHIDMGKVAAAKDGHRHMNRQRNQGDQIFRVDKAEALLAPQRIIGGSFITIL